MQCRSDLPPRSIRCGCSQSRVATMRLDPLRAYERGRSEHRIERGAMRVIFVRPRRSRRDRAPGPRSTAASSAAAVLRVIASRQRRRARSSVRGPRRQTPPRARPRRARGGYALISPSTIDWPRRTASGTAHAPDRPVVLAGVVGHRRADKSPTTARLAAADDAQPLRSPRSPAARSAPWRERAT